MSVLDLFGIVDGDASVAHKDHLVTTSYARHEALGAFYKDVRDAADAFIEASIAMGVDGFVADVSKSIEDRLENDYIALLEIRDEQCAGDKTLETLYDNIGAVYLKALYKLKQFK